MEAFGRFLLIVRSSSNNTVGYAGCSRAQLSCVVVKKHVKANGLFRGSSVLDGVLLECSEDAAFVSHVLMQFLSRPWRPVVDRLFH